ncbi:hypothetical protein V6N11_079253 [Hibiscus sabdariffa]|uniref:Uncharacterized protein n=1 Tax=Hibiscus sabdariffa TaxID=183260 RepID=A0ABR2RVI9_9ROSI
MVDQSGWYPWVMGFRKNGEVLLQVANGEMASLDLNCQKMDPHGVLVGVGLMSYSSYVESLVLLDEGVECPQTLGNHAATGPLKHVSAKSALSK